MIFDGKNRVTQPYGSGHGGIDIVGDNSRNVHAVSAGVVDLVQFWDGKTKSGSQSYGNLVRIKSDSGIYVYYAHLSKINVAKNQRVNIGDAIGIMGNSGNSFGAHLHLEARSGKTTSTRISPCQICSLKNKKGIYRCDAEKSHNSTDTAKIKAGKEIKLENAKLYVSSDAKNHACRKSGRFYIYSEEIINKRIRITCSNTYVGKAPAKKYVTGWIDADIIT